ncbi:hypothetical protein [Formosa sp. S-31]|uniref:hypothetical protein n=1 Tax=Formosa sp. S-31 TaxID=2790949 RepID=UPI003EBD2ACC
MMKNIIKIFMLIGVLATFFTCSEDDYSLGRKLDPSELDFSVVQDYAVDEGGNTVILINNTPETVPVWDYGTGTSTRAVDTIRFAFAGDYTIKFSAVTDGGIVDAEPVTISVTQDNFSYINNDIWNMISGGVGNSKRWYLDLDSEGQSKYFAGPMYFYGTDNGWLEGGGPSADGGQSSGCYGDDCWNWNPDWPGNTWLMDAADYGYMEFSLEGGPFVTVDHLTLPELGTQNGTYNIDLNNYKLSMSNAQMIHNVGYDTCSSNWGDITIFSITEDAMQLGVLREQIGSCSGEGLAMIVYNFISQEYSENWVPEETEPEPEEPTLPEGWEDTISAITTKAIEWKLSESNPLNWATLGGTLMNDWQTPEDYPTDWLGTPDPAVYGDFSMTMNSADNSVVFVTPDGITTEGTYSIDGSGIYSFNVPVPTFQLINTVNFEPDTNNQLRLLKIDTDANGNVTDMWLGAVDDVNKPTEYKAFHLVPNVGGSGGEGGNEGTEVAFDNSKLVYGDLEGNGNLRLELYNEYGSTVADPGVNTEDLASFESIEVTFTLSGVTLNEGAVGTYNASMYYADSDWNPNGNGEIITVNGDGTYTVSYNPGAVVEGVIVFVIDVAGLATDVTDLEAVTATIDSIVIN